MRIAIRNFRSVEHQEIDIAPLTLVYGPNGAGKSSLLYSLLTLKNFLLSPNQNLSGLFNYGFLSLGGFDAVAFNHQSARPIELALSTSGPWGTATFGLQLLEASANVELKFDLKDAAGAMALPISLPYPGNQQANTSVGDPQAQISIQWNGLTAQTATSSTDSAVQAQAKAIMLGLNSPAEILRRVSVIPLKRGFSRPVYQAVPLTPQLASDDEVATLLSTEKYLRAKVSHYLEQIVMRDFSVNVTLGTSQFSLDSTDRATGLPTELVNEGFGVNQLVYLLARSLHKDAGVVCVEEPELHLHPSAARRLAVTLAKVMKQEGKRFVVSTHSEAFLGSLLDLVAKGDLSANDLSCLYANKTGMTTKFEPQSINSKGQIRGGLVAFLDEELVDIREFVEEESRKIAP